MQAMAKPMVEPFARALGLLSAFTPQDQWLGNTELSQRTDLPASTVSRMAQTLVVLGYLLHDPVLRKYRLTSAVLSLGYAAFANAEVERLARLQMQSFANQEQSHVVLSSRYRLDIIVLESCRSAHSTGALNLHIGNRVGMATSPMGWALLASLPEAERYYLLNNLERRMPREWPHLRRRASEAISKVYEAGYCSSVSDTDPNLGMLAAPVQVGGDDPRVLACVVQRSLLKCARTERALGNRLIAIANDLKQAGVSP
jgi:DNA-binding IclR family transcriptional regulator